MSALANQMVTVTLGWREPNGQVIEFGGGAGSPAPSTPAAPSPTFSSSSDQGSERRSASGPGAVDLFA